MRKQEQKREEQMGRLKRHVERNEKDMWSWVVVSEVLYHCFVIDECNRARSHAIDEE